MIENICNLQTNLISEKFEYFLLSWNKSFKQIQINNFTTHMINISSLTEKLNLLQQNSAKSFIACSINHFLWTYIPPFIFILGSLGNVLTFLVLKHPSTGSISMFVYLTARSVVDEIVLIVGLFRRWIDYLVGIKLENTSHIMCKFVHFWGTSSSLLSVWLTVALTAERALVVSFPLHVTRIVTYSRVKIIIFGLSFIAILLSMQFFITIGLINNCGNATKNFNNTYNLNFSRLLNIKNSFCYNHCSFLPQYKTISWYWITFDAVSYSYLPFCLIFSLNLIILHFVHNAKREHKSLRLDLIENKIDSSIQPTFTLSRRPLSTTDNGYNVRQLTVMLLVISFAFLLTTVFIVLMKILAQTLDLRGSFKWKARSYFQLADTIAELFMYINHAMNFYLFCFTGKRFRTRLILLLTKFKRDGLFACHKQFHLKHINIRFCNTNLPVQHSEIMNKNKLFVINTGSNSLVDFKFSEIYPFSETYQYQIYSSDNKLNQNNLKSKKTLFKKLKIFLKFKHQTKIKLQNNLKLNQLNHQQYGSKQSFQFFKKDSSHKSNKFSNLCKHNKTIYQKTILKYYYQMKNHLNIFMRQNIKNNSLNSDHAYTYPMINNLKKHCYYLNQICPICQSKREFRHF